jgi:1,4-alpha-glucan branching enzyme
MEVVPVLRQSADTSGVVKVTFVLPLSEYAQPVSVLGGFNGWNPLTHPLKRRSNGTRSVTVAVPAGQDYEFKYLAEGGEWFCDPQADSIVAMDVHAFNSVLRT